MKKLVFFLILLMAFTVPLRAQAQNINWVTLQSDITALTAPGQPVQIMLDGSLNTPIKGAGLILSYDPACFKVTGHQPGSLLPGAKAFAQEKPGQLDLTYYFQGSGQGLTGEGSLITIQLETLNLCASDLSATPDTITLGVLNDQGMAFNLTGVEYRTLSVHLAPSNGQPVIPPVVNNQGKSPVTTSASQNPISVYLVLLFVFILAGIGLAGYFLLNRLLRENPRQPALAAASVKTGTPALIHNGRPIPLPQTRTQLGRHIEIVKHYDGFYLADTGSQRGTFLNGSRLGAGYHRLHDGDQIQLGQEVSYRFVESHKSQ
jgi:hypothetical protein